MSAVRRNDRRANRSTLSSPYARPSKSSRGLQQSKKSLWSLSGLINFLNPFGGNKESDDSDISSPSDSEIEQGPPPRRFSPLQSLPPPLPQQQQSPSNSSRPSVIDSSTAGSNHVTQTSAQQPFSLNMSSPTSFGSSMAKNLEPVTRFLVEKAGQPLNEFEAAGIVDYIQKNVQGSTFVPDKPEPFRFSVSPSRSASPNQTQGISNIQTPRKTLSRNPNGVYRWQGAGSSRPRNRYQSPGFAPRPQQHRIKLSPPKTPPTTDTKRRRVGDEAESSVPQKPVVPSTSTTSFQSSMPESPAPPSQRAAGPSVTFLNGKPTSALTSAPPVTPPKTNGIQPRIRTSGLPMKPTTPAIPSPLRQTWKESDSPPQSSPPFRPTRAADFMSELIKEVTPTKKPDVFNPYQTASPVKPPAPARKPVVKRPKPGAAKTEFPEVPKKQEPEVSAQAIIEATVPKGIKRSRPPPETGKPAREEEVPDREPLSSVLNGSTHATHVDCDMMETAAQPGGEESPSKRRKTPPTRLSSKIQDVDDSSVSKAFVRPTEIIEPVDDAAHMNGKPAPPPAITVSPPSATKPLFGIAKTSAPKEPSKLRYSFQADKVEVKGMETVPAPLLAPLFASPPALPPTMLKTLTAPAKVRLTSKEEVLMMDLGELPTYTFSVETSTSYPAGSSFSAARSAVLSLPTSSLPTYEFAPVPVPVRAMNGFNWTAAGLKSPTTSAQTWVCSLCQLQNPADAREKCTICDAPRQAPTASSPPAPTIASITTVPAAIPPPTPPLKSFDWSAAGLAPPLKPGSGTWICSLCLLTNSASATDKCSTCDTPR